MDHGGDTSNGTFTNPCRMMMYFHTRPCEMILWKGWLPTTVTNFVLSAIAIFLLCFVYEVIKFVREQLLVRDARKDREARRIARELQNKAENNGCSDGCSNAATEFREKSVKERMFASGHLVQTLLNMIQITISYLIMLIIMLYNYWLCLAIILGLGMGYVFFGWVKKDPDASECCP
ncbi:high affinity copper uptake protein 1-like [Scaptodrosophila lebanonensis]|uniref:Copper transport protein n=1 Tax=Drosophila lebanonensis TaxID=7225 RepID=A0A6J2T3R0_DROLE|nr:high affinity copper uptake protein 1-like [Scaptodrosophila lebanonensis]